MSDVIKFRSLAELEGEADREYAERAHAEAIRMLEDALVFVRGQVGRRVCGVAIAMAFDDRCYASHIPTGADNFGSLIAAVADCQHRLLVHTNRE